MRAVKRSLDSDEDLQLKPYSHYKPSAVKWLDDVPHHWEVRRFGTLAQGFNNGITADQLEIGESNHLVSRIETISKGAIDYTRVGYLAEGSDHQAYLLEEHDFLISHINSYARVGNSARHRGERPLIHGMNLIRITPFNAVVPSYLEYLLKSDVFIGAMRRVCKPAINQVSVTTTAIKAIRLPLPPLPEQAAIVRYLDHADRRIRRYVDAKRKLIALLEEEKQAIVNQAVTRGMDPNVPLKPSGVEWLGDVPSHWEVRRLKRVLYSLIDCEHKTAPAIDVSSYRVVRTSAVRGGTLLLSGTYCTSEEAFAEWTRRASLEPGDVIFTREAPAGEACVVPSGLNLCLGQRTVLMKVDRHAYEPQFLVHMLYTGPPHDEIELASQGSTLPHFNVEDIGALPVLAPPVSEQREIVDWLEAETGDLTYAIVRARRQIELVEEYRTRLIADVVTGKLDVREAAAQLSEEDEGLELHETAGFAGEVERL